MNGRLRGDRIRLDYRKPLAVKLDRNGFDVVQFWKDHRAFCVCLVLVFMAAAVYGIGKWSASDAHAITRGGDAQTAVQYAISKVY